LYILIFKFLDGQLKDRRFCTEWQQAFPDFSQEMLTILAILPVCM